MTRRGFVAGLCAALALAPGAGAHTLYGQWVVYRKKHLLVGCHREDPETYRLAQEVVAAFEAVLPEAKARIARARRPDRLASLLATDQLEIAVLSADDVADMAAGVGRFAPYGPVDLGLIAHLPGDGPQGRLLVSRAAFPARHAWLTRSALVETGLLGFGAAPVAAHPGAAAFDAGIRLERLPEPQQG